MHALISWLLTALAAAVAIPTATLCIEIVAGLGRSKAAVRLSGPRRAVSRRPRVLRRPHFMIPVD